MSKPFWAQVSSRQANKIVYAVLKKHSPTPLTTQEIYGWVHKYTSGDVFGQVNESSAKDGEFALPTFKLDPQPVPPEQPISYNKRKMRKGITPRPPYPEHPIRSLTFLKRKVLPSLVAQVLVEKYHIKPIDELRLLSPTPEVKPKSKSKSKANSEPTQNHFSDWVWRLRLNPVQHSKEQTKPKRYGEEVGVGEDWSHLSKRRQSSRVGKVSRDVGAFREWDKGNRALDEAKLVSRKESLKIHQAVEGGSTDAVIGL